MPARQGQTTMHCLSRGWPRCRRLVCPPVSPSIAITSPSPVPDGHAAHPSARARRPAPPWILPAVLTDARPPAYSPSVASPTMTANTATRACGPTRARRETRPRCVAISSMPLSFLLLRRSRASRASTSGTISQRCRTPSRPSTSSRGTTSSWASSPSRPSPSVCGPTLGPSACSSCSAS